MSSLECNSSSASLKKVGVGKIKPINGRLIQANIRLRANSKIDAFIYKDSSSPIRNDDDTFGSQTVEDSINQPLADFKVDFFNYVRLIELATTIDPETGMPLDAVPATASGMDGGTPVMEPDLESETMKPVELPKGGEI